MNTPYLSNVALQSQVKHLERNIATLTQRDTQDVGITTADVMAESVGACTDVL